MAEEINWKQEVQEEICGIEDVNLNTATLTFRINNLGGMLGLEEKITEISRKLIVKSPSAVHARLVDGKRYQSGDFLCWVAFSRLKAAHEPLESDPKIVVDGEIISLDEARPFLVGDNWGIRLGEDTLTFGDTTWHICGVRGELWLNNEPARVELTLR